MNKVIIRNTKELREAIKNGHQEFAIALNGGLKSCKFININKKNLFIIENSIDGSTQTLNDKQIMNDKYTNIGKAMALGSFYIDE